MKHLLLTLFFFAAVANMSSAQSHSTTELFDDWKPLAEKENISFEYKVVVCDFNAGYDEIRVILRVNNNSNQNVHIQWDTERFVNGECYNCDNVSESHRILKVNANETLTGECSRRTMRELQYYVKFKDRDVRDAMSHIEIKNIIVTPF